MRFDSLKQYLVSDEQLEKKIYTNVHKKHAELAIVTSHVQNVLN